MVRTSSVSLSWHFICQILTCPHLDSTEQKKRWEENYEEYLEYCKEVESELNQRFKFILQGTPEAATAQEVSTTCYIESAPNTNASSTS